MTSRSKLSDGCVKVNGGRKALQHAFVWLIYIDIFSCKLPVLWWCQLNGIDQLCKGTVVILFNHSWHLCKYICRYMYAWSWIGNHCLWRDTWFLIYNKIRHYWPRRLQVVVWNVITNVSTERKRSNQHMMEQPFLMILIDLSIYKSFNNVYFMVDPM